MAADITSPSQRQKRPQNGGLTILQRRRAREALLAKTRREVRGAGSAEGLRLADRTIDPIEASILQEAGAHGWVGAHEGLIALLVEVGEHYESCSFELQCLARDALVGLLRYPANRRLQASDGLRTACEVPHCEEVFTVKREKGLLGEIVENGDGPSEEIDSCSARLLLNGLEQQMGLPPTRAVRFGVAQWDVPPGYASNPVPRGTVRYLIVCPGCRRRRLRRCEHATRAWGEWSRCPEIAAGSVYCEEHRRATYRHARAHGYRHRRIPTR